MGFRLKARGPALCGPLPLRACGSWAKICHRWCGARDRSRHRLKVVQPRLKPDDGRKGPLANVAGVLVTRGLTASPPSFPEKKPLSASIRQNGDIAAGSKPRRTFKQPRATRPELCDRRLKRMARIVIRPQNTTCHPTSPSFTKLLPALQDVQKIGV